MSATRVDVFAYRLLLNDANGFFDVIGAMY
jgi:hypothetical protein